LLIENIVPSIAGAALGVLLAIGGCDLLASYIARYSTRASEITVDTTVLGVALVVAVAAASFFAFLPRLPGTGSRRLGWFSGTRSTAGVAGRRTQRLLVVSQVGVSFVLLVGAGLLLETLRNLQRDDGGVALEEVLVMNVPISYGTRTPDELFAHHGTILEKVAALPGVRSAALGSMIPLKQTPRGVLAGLAALEFEIEGQPTEPGAPPPRADFRIVSGGNFHTLGMTLIQGRTFQSTDTRDAPKVVVVNQALADHYFPDREVLGQRIGWRGDTLHFMGVTQEYRTIVGVVSDAKDYGVAEDVPYVAFNPVTEVPLAGSLFVRTAKADVVVRPILDLIHEIDPEQPVVDVGTLAQIRSESISPQRLNAALMGAFAVLALTVAAVGVAGVLAFGVSQRTHEFGVRAALGADRSVLMRVVLKEGARLALFGVAIGLAASLLFAGLISGLLHGVAPTDVGTLGVAALLLTLVALLASAVPAWRASEIDPVQALREE
jgi:predicted permease